MSGNRVKHKGLNCPTKMAGQPVGPIQLAYRQIIYVLVCRAAAVAIGKGPGQADTQQKKATRSKSAESRNAPICENISYRQENGEQTSNGCSPPHCRWCQEMQQPNVINYQMMLLGMLGHMGHIICEIDTSGNNARDIPKDNFEAFLAHF